MEQLFNRKELINDPFQDPMGQDAHRGLELFMDKFHQPTVPTHTIITDPEYYVMLWFHNANGNLIHCPYVQMPGSDETQYFNPLTPDIDFYKINRAFGSENKGIQSGTIYNAGFNSYGGKTVYGKSQESLELHEKCLDLTPFVREASLPDIQPANAEKIQTLFGETTAGSFSPYASDGQRSITLQVLDTEFSILDAIFYPWMKDINSPWWYKPYQAYTEWATPYPMATLEIQRPRMRYRTDYPKFDEQSRLEAKYVYYSYKFIGVKPTNYTAFEVNGAGRNSLLRTLTMVADMCIVDLDDDARGTQDSRSNYGRRETLIFNKDWKNPESDTEDNSLQPITEQEKLDNEAAHLKEVEEKIDAAKKELEQQKVGDQPGWEELEYPDMGRKMKEWSTEFRRDPEALKKYLDTHSDEDDRVKKEEEEKKKEQEEKKKADEKKRKEKEEEESRRKAEEEQLRKEQEQEKEEEEDRRKREREEEELARKKAEEEARKKTWNDYLEQTRNGEYPPPWKKSMDDEDSEMPRREIVFNGQVYEAKSDGTWEKYDYDGYAPGQMSIIGNNAYEWDADNKQWVQADLKKPPEGDGTEGHRDPSGFDSKEKERYDQWVNSGDAVYLPGADGKLMKGQNGKWTEVPDSEVPKDWKKDSTGKWTSSNSSGNSPWNVPKYDKPVDGNGTTPNLDNPQNGNVNAPQPSSPPESEWNQENQGARPGKWMNESVTPRSRSGEMPGRLTREIRQIIERYQESSQVFLQDSNQTFTQYIEQLEESLSRYYTLFKVFTDGKALDFNTAIICGIMCNSMQEAFPAIWSMIDPAQNHMIAMSDMVYDEATMGKQQMKDYVQQMQKCTDQIVAATDQIDELNTAFRDILQNMEFVGKVVASVFKAAQIVGDQSVFVGEFGSLINRMMDNSGFNPSPIQTYVDIVTGNYGQEEEED